MSAEQLSVSFPPRRWVRFGERDRVHSVVLAKTLNLRRTETDQDWPKRSFNLTTVTREALGCFEKFKEGIVTKDVITKRIVTESIS